jgi:adenine phosphoribosyltransferase
MKDMEQTMNLDNYIRDVKDFPKEGIVFKDITPLLKDSKALNSSVEQIAEKFKNVDYDLVVGPESRGFIFGVGVAIKEGKGFVPVRKPGKLPSDKVSISYELEYGSDTLEVHKDAVSAGQKVLIVDDLLATGGTMKATIDLLRGIGADVVGCGFLVELDFLKGRERLDGVKVESILQY